MRPQPLLFALFLAFPLLAQSTVRSNELAGWAVSGSIGWTLAADDREIDYDQVVGLGASYSRRLSPRFSTELALSRARAEGTISVDGEILGELPALELTALTATAQWHFGSDRFDPFLGAGVALMAADVEGLSVDRKPAWLLNAGVGFGFSERIGVVFDGRYIRYRPDATGAGEPLRLDLDPFLVSAGVRFRF